jgi:hypothetical protein
MNELGDSIDWAIEYGEPLVADFKRVWAMPTPTP